MIPVHGWWGWKKSPGEARVAPAHSDAYWQFCFQQRSPAQLWYLLSISWTEAPTPPASSTAAARLAKTQLEEADVLTRNRYYTEQWWGTRGEQKGEKSSLGTWYVQMHEGQNGFGSMNLGQHTAQMSPSVWRYNFIWFATPPAHGHLKVYGRSCGQRGKQKGKKNKYGKF